MKKILVTGGMLTYMILFNAGIVSASMLPEISASDDIQGTSTHENARHQKNFEAKITRIADKLGLDADELARDVQSSKSIKQILKKHGITKNQLRELMSNKHTK